MNRTLTQTHSKPRTKSASVVVQQHSRKLLKMGILMPETCWVSKKKNKNNKWHLVGYFIIQLSQDARSNKHQMNCLYWSQYNNVIKAVATKGSFCSYIPTQLSSPAAFLSWNITTRWSRLVLKQPIKINIPFYAIRWFITMSTSCLPLNPVMRHMHV